MIVQDDLNPAQPREIEKPLPDLTEIQFSDNPETAERRVAVLMRSLSLMLSIAFFVEAGWVAWKPDSSQMIYQIALSSAIFFLFLRLALSKFELPRHVAHPVAAFSCLVAVGYSIADLHLGKTPWATTQMLIILLAAGFIFSSRAWFTALVIVSCLGWFWAAAPKLSDDMWIQMGVALLVTVIWATWFLETRMRSLAAFEREAAQEDYKRAVEETQFFVRSAKGKDIWCPVCKASLDPIIRHDGEKIIDVNPAAAKLLDMSRSALEGMSIATVLAPEKREGLQDALRLGNFEPTETVAFRKDNSRVPVEMLNGGTSLDVGGMKAMVLRDLSENERAKERVREATARSQQLLRRQGELALLAGTPDTAENLDHIMNLIVGAAHRWLPSTLGVFVVLWDNHTQGFTVTAASAPGHLQTEKLPSADDPRGLIGWLTTHKESLVVPKMGDDSFGIRALYPHQSVEAFAAFPLSGAAGVIGFLLALEMNPREFPPQDVEFLSILAHRATTCCLQVALQEQLNYTTGGAQ